MGDLEQLPVVVWRRLDALDLKTQAGGAGLNTMLFELLSRATDRVC